MNGWRRESVKGQTAVELLSVAALPEEVLPTKALEIARPRVRAMVPYVVGTTGI